MQEGPADHSYCLPAQLTAETAAEILQALAPLPIPPHSRLTLDASGVETLSAAGAQLLVSAHHSLSQSQGELILREPAPDVRRALAEMGLDWLVR